jgi:hypothetical protein
MLEGMGMTAASTATIDPAARSVRIEIPHDPAHGFAPAWWDLELGTLEPGRWTLVVPWKRGWPSYGIQKHAAYRIGNHGWQLTPAADVDLDMDAVRYRIEVDGGPCRFARFLPAPIPTVPPTPQVEHRPLTHSEGGRAIPEWVLGDRSDDAAVIYATARSHAFESGSTLVLESAVAQLAKDMPRGLRLHAIPVVDVDGVALGRTGKGRAPRDHNQCWDDAAEWAGVRTLMARICDDAERGALRAVLDLHGPGRARPYLFVEPEAGLDDKQRAARQQIIAAFAVEPWSNEMLDPPTLDRWAYVERVSPSADPRFTTQRRWVTDRFGGAVLSALIEVCMDSPLAAQAGIDRQGADVARAIRRLAQS